LVEGYVGSSVDPVVDVCDSSKGKIVWKRGLIESEEKAQQQTRENLRVGSPSLYSSGGDYEEGCGGSLFQLTVNSNPAEVTITAIFPLFSDLRKCFDMISSF